MRAEVSGDELLISIDEGELGTKATARSLPRGCPVARTTSPVRWVRRLAAPTGASDPVTVRSVTVRLVRTQVIASETLMLDGAREIFA